MAKLKEKLSKFFMDRLDKLGAQRPLGGREILTKDIRVEVPDDAGSIRIQPTHEGILIETNAFHTHEFMIKLYAGNVLAVVMVPKHRRKMALPKELQELVDKGTLEIDSEDENSFTIPDLAFHDRTAEGKGWTWYEGEWHPNEQTVYVNTNTRRYGRGEVFDGDVHEFIAWLDQQSEEAE